MSTEARGSTHGQQTQAQTGPQTPLILNLAVCSRVCAVCLSRKAPQWGWRISPSVRRQAGSQSDHTSAHPLTPATQGGKLGSSSPTLTEAPVNISLLHPPPPSPPPPPPHPPPPPTGPRHSKSVLISQEIVRARLSSPVTYICLS